MGGNRTVTLTWDAVSTATGYEVQQWDGYEARWRIPPFQERYQTEQYTIDLSGTQAVVGQLGNGVSYYHRVRAVRNDEVSPWTAVYITTSTAADTSARTTTGGNSATVAAPIPAPVPPWPRW